MRQLLTESVLLSLAGAVVGSAAGILGIRALLSVNTARLPRVGEEGALVGLDWRVLVFTILVAVATGLLFGLIPALQTSRPDLSATLKESSGRSGTGFRQNKARTLLAVSEIALAVVLLVGAALLIRTFLNLGGVNPGFNADNVLTMRMSLTGQRFAKSAGIERLVQDGVARVNALPGVTLASATCCVPLEGGYGLPFLVMGRPLTDGPFHGGGGWLTVSPGYFEVFKIPIVRGRAFTERDDGAAAPVVLINQAMAKRFWPKADPLSDKIWIGKGIMTELAAETPRQIIGIVGDVRGGLDNDPGPTMYVPNAQVPDALNALNVRITPMKWVVRTRVNPFTLSSAIQEQLRQASGLPVSDVRTMDEVVSRSTSRQRFDMLLDDGIRRRGAVPGCPRRLRPDGLLRAAAHARRSAFAWLSAPKPATFSGWLSSRVCSWRSPESSSASRPPFGLSRLLASFLFGVQPRDLAVFIAVPLTLTLVSLIAVWLPARRAARSTRRSPCAPVKVTGLLACRFAGNFLPAIV